MKRTINYLLYLLVLFCFIPVNMMAGGWTQPKGKFYSHLAYTFHTFNNVHQGFWGDNKDLTRRVNDGTLQAYLEFGATDKLTLTGMLPVKFTTTGNTIYPNENFADTLAAGSLNGLGNVVLGVKYRLLQKKWVMSGQLQVAALTSNRDATTGLQTDRDSWGILPSLLLSKGLNKKFLSMEIGVEVRTNQQSERITGFFEYGRQLNNDMWIIGLASWYISLKNGEFTDGNFLQTGLYVNDQEYFSMGAKAIIPFNENTGINVALLGGIYGKNVASFPSITVGLFVKTF